MMSPVVVLQLLQSLKGYCAVQALLHFTQEVLMPASKQRRQHVADTLIDASSAEKWGEHRMHSEQLMLEHMCKKTRSTLQTHAGPWQ